MDDNPLGRRLLPGEDLLWLGSPAPGLLLTWRDALVVPGALVWFGVAMTVFVDLPASAPLPFYLFLIPFLCVGLFLLGGRFAVDAWIRGRTAYAVTDRRVLIERTAPFASFTTLDLLHLPDVKLTGERRARGTIRFGSAFSLYAQQLAFFVPVLETTPQFLAIEGASEVFQLILDTSHSLRRNLSVDGR